MSSSGYKYDIGYLCCGTEIFSPGIQTETCPPYCEPPELKIACVMGRWHQVWTMSVIDRILVWLLLKLWLMNANTTRSTLLWEPREASCPLFIQIDMLASMHLFFSFPVLCGLHLSRSETSKQDYSQCCQWAVLYS